METTAIAIVRVDPNSAVALHDQLTCGTRGLEVSAELLLRLPYNLRSVARQERTYRLNMIGGLPSDHLRGAVEDLLAGRALTSPTATAMLADLTA